MRTRILRFGIVCLVGSFLISSLIIPRAFAKEQEPIKIGVLLPISGVYAQLGKDFLNGIEMYAEKMGYTSGGRKIELLVEDSEALPNTALLKVKRLKEMKNSAIVLGPVMTNEIYAVQPYTESKKLPVIAFGSADDITQRKRGKYMLRGGFTSSQATHPFGEYCYKVLGYRKIAVLGPDYAFGWEVTGGMQKTFEELGGKITQKLWFPITSADFSPYLAQLSKDNDATFQILGGKVAIMLTRQYREYGLKEKIPLIGMGQTTDESILSELGEDALGAITVFSYSAALDTPANKAFVKKYSDRFGKIASTPAEMGYVVMQLVDQALISLKGNVNNPDNIVKALKSIQVVDSPQGPFKFDAYGNLDLNIYIRKVEKVEGKLQNTVIYTYPMVSQFWKYDPKEFLKDPAYSRDYPPRKP
jgi:branched-chain amino acid transport system substrate-binding protein